MSSSNSISNSTISTRQGTFHQDTGGNNGNGRHDTRNNTNNNNNGSQNPNGNNYQHGNNYQQYRQRDNNRNRTGNYNNNNTNRDSSHRNTTSDHTRPNQSAPKFKGATSDMHGHIFGCNEEQGDRRQHLKTVAALQQCTTKLPFSEDFQCLFKATPTIPTLSEPTPPVTSTKDTAAVTEMQDLIFKEEIKQFVSQRMKLRSNLVAVWNIIIGQCTDTMKAKLEAHADFDEHETRRDCAWLLTTILAITLQFDNRRYRLNTLMEAYQKFFTCRQSSTQTVDDYRQTLTTWADIIDHHGGTLVFTEPTPATTSTTTKNKNAPSAEQQREASRQATLAMIFLRNADHSRYNTLLTELANSYAAGRDQYPKDLLTAYSLLLEYKTPYNHRPRQQDHPRPDPNRPDPNRQSSNNTTTTTTTATTTPTSSAGTSTNNSTTTDTRPPSTIRAVTTFAQAVHPALPSTNPPAATQGTTLAQWAAMMAQHTTERHTIDPSWLLLDSQSTMSVFHNKDLLTDIRPAPTPICAITNGGSQTSSFVGEFHGLGFPCTTWYNPDSIANILSLAEIRRLCRITMDSSSSPSISVHRPDGSVLSFHEHPSGLYVHSSPSAPSPPATYTFLSTVAENKKQFTPRQIQQADAARRLYRMLGRPDEKLFRKMLNENQILNCPITSDDALRALTIYGPDVATLKGKMTRATAAARAPSFTAVPLPAPLLEFHPNVTLCVDFFFIQEQCFLHTISRDIGFRTAVPVPDRYASTITKELRRVIHLYTIRGFTVTDVHGDHEFAKVESTFAPTHFNIVAADGHVGEVERSIRTIKERFRAFAHGLPFRRLPLVLLKAIVTEVLRCLNHFPWAAGISPTLSPATIVTGCPRLDFQSLRLEFGSYVQLFDDFSPSNTPRARSLGAIALGPTGNAQNAYHFLSLASGSQVSRHRWTELPITDLAIARVEAIAFAEGQPLLQLRNFVTEHRPDYPLDESAYDADYIPLPSHTNDDDDDFSVTTPFDDVDDSELDDLAADTHHFPDPDDSDDPDPGDFPDDSEDDAPPDMPGAHHTLGTPGGGAHPSPAHHATLSPPGNPPAPSKPPPILRPPSPPILRPRTGRRTTFADAVDSPHSSTSYYPPKAYQFFQYLPPKCTKPVITDTFSEPRLSDLTDRARHAVQFIFAHVSEEMSKITRPHTQLSFREGLRRYGRDAEIALLKEYAQFDDYNVFEPLNAALLTFEQRRDALRAIELITEKRNGLLKGRTCVDGRPQRPFYDKLATSSPTIATDALILSILIDAYEGRDVATADVAGAYLNAFMKDFVILKFTGASVRLLCELNPTHRAFVVIENGVEVLYVRLLKALYGCVQSALLWYELFSNTLQDMGFTLNPYDQCVANCDIEGSQCTICWYVDDTKISHKDPAVVQAVIDRLESKFRTMKVTRGDSHVFLGMHITYVRASNTANISMRDYLTESIDESSLSITTPAPTPAANNLFSIDTSSPALSPTSREVFHSVVAKLLYVSLRGRMDLLLTTSFLATRVTQATQQDLRKLRRLLEYIYGTLDDEYTVGADDLGRLRTWVDASYAVHPDCRSHTGGAISFGRGALLCKSVKQKLNTKSSTEAETVGASDYMPNTIWVQHFMESQGYTVTSNILEQDNESAIRLATNGRASAGPKSRHIDIRYFWLKDRIQSHDIAIRHCPTTQMLADFFTKPLQGHLFRFFKAVVLGQRHVDTLGDPIAQPLEERVEDDQSATTTMTTFDYARRTYENSLPTSGSEDSNSHQEINQPSSSHAHSFESIQLT